MKTIVRVLAACAAFAAPAAGQAQAWPAKPVHLVVAFAPGGPADIVARLLGQRLARAGLRLRQVGDREVAQGRPGNRREGRLTGARASR
jgi:tripartite-type tricarboxylate transporter receptor subunit TctC